MFIIAINYFPYLYEHKLVRDKNTSFLLKRKKKKKADYRMWLHSQSKRAG